MTSIGLSNVHFKGHGETMNRLPSALQGKACS